MEVTCATGDKQKKGGGGGGYKGKKVKGCGKQSWQFFFLLVCFREQEMQKVLLLSPGVQLSVFAEGTPPPPSSPASIYNTAPAAGESEGTSQRGGRHLAHPPYTAGTVQWDRGGREKITCPEKSAGLSCSLPLPLQPCGTSAASPSTAAEGCCCPAPPARRVRAPE